MAKKELPAERGRNKKGPKAQNKNKNKGKNPATIGAKSNSRKKETKAAADDASGEDNEVLEVPSSSTESQKDDVSESREAEGDRADMKEEKKKPRGKGEKTKPKSKEVQKNKSNKRRIEEVEAKNEGKKRSKKDEDDVESDVEEKNENALYRFPMNRISRIMRGENPDFRISQEAVFLINRASEKFLQFFCREAYACAFLEDKRYIAYNHLAFVVAKRKRFGFLSDFVPEKVKAEDALAQVSAAEK